MTAIPPALVLLAGWPLVAFLPRTPRNVATVLLPLAALAYVASLSPGTTLAMPFLAGELEPLRVDRLSLLFGGIFSLIAAIGAVYAWHESDRRQQLIALAYAAGALGVTFAGDLLTLYAFWELMAVAAAALVWARGTRASQAAGLRYLLVHLTGGAVLLLGIALHTSATGTLSFRAFDADAPTLGAWLVLGGFCVNAAVPPLGAWLPDAYPRASVTGAVLLSALTTKSAVYALLRGFAGWDVLVAAGVIMALFGIVYAMLANDVRELLSYHIVSQVGYMVAGTGIGTALAVNGAAAHAVCHILYKALLFMGAGAVMTTTGRRKLTDLGGFGARQPAVVALYLVGAFSISGVPLWNGFVSKSMVVAAAGEAHFETASLLLTLASVGTFLSTTLKLPYFTWMGPDRDIHPSPAPASMLVAMGAAAVLCTALGVWPEPLYRLLPYPVDYDPFTWAHLIETLQLLVFTFFAFALLRPMLAPHAGVSIDFDVLYRKSAPLFRAILVDGVGAVFQAVQDAAERVAATAAAALRDPTAWRFGRLPAENFDPDRSRRPLLGALAVALATFAALAAALLSWR